MGAFALVTTPGDAQECPEDRSHNRRVAGSSPARPTIRPALLFVLMGHRVEGGRDGTNMQATAYISPARKSVNHVTVRVRSTRR